MGLTQAQGNDNTETPKGLDFVHKTSGGYKLFSFSSNWQDAMHAYASEFENIGGPFFRYHPDRFYAAVNKDTAYEPEYTRNTSGTDMSGTKTESKDYIIKDKGGRTVVTFSYFHLEYPAGSKTEIHEGIEINGIHWNRMPVNRRGSSYSSIEDMFSNRNPIPSKMSDVTPEIISASDLTECLCAFAASLKPPVKINLGTFSSDPFVFGKVITKNGELREAHLVPEDAIFCSFKGSEHATLQ